MFLIKDDFWGKQHIPTFVQDLFKSCNLNHTISNFQLKKTKVLIMNHLISLLSKADHSIPYQIPLKIQNNAAMDSSAKENISSVNMNYDRQTS